ncbi:hypothetical protein [Burkholderia phage vB_BpP_HN02]|uniref:Uncharacterized protein n=1 Tax=Burkholderia phage vB_BpP_HN02 TaxID=3116925 RepID=A0AAX4JIY3_9CAUD
MNKFKRGGSFSYGGFLWDPGECAPFTLEGCTVTAALRRKVKFEFVQDLNVDILDAATNAVRVYAPPKDTEKWRPQVHFIDFKVVDSNGEVVHTTTSFIDVVDHVTN